LVTKCVTGHFLQLTFNDVGRGQKVLSKPSADSFAVGRRQKEAATCTLEFSTISDYANGNQHSSDQSVNKNETTPRRLQDYIHGAELDSDSLGLLPVPDYDQSDMRNLLNESSDYIQMRIQGQEEELRARNAQDQAVIQKRLSKGPRNASPRED
jgi:hypothetical protein